MATTRTRKSTTAPAPAASNGAFTFEETDSVVRSAGAGRTESELTLAIRQAVAVAVETGKTYKTAETWGTPDEKGNPQASTDHGRSVVQTLQREGRRAGVTIKVGADTEDGRKVPGSRIIYVAVKQVKRPRKDQQEAAAKELAKR